MSVRNFFSMAVTEPTGCFAFFAGSVLGVKAYFRASFEGNNFYLKIKKEGRWVKSYIRVKYFPTNSGLCLLEVEIYNPKTGQYETLSLNDKDMAFLHRITSTCSEVLNRAATEWRNSEDYIIPF